MAVVRVLSDARRDSIRGEELVNVGSIRAVRDRTSSLAAMARDNDDQPFFVRPDVPLRTSNARHRGLNQLDSAACRNFSGVIARRHERCLLRHPRKRTNAVRSESDAHEPLANQSGRWWASAPIVVSSPCPGSVRVASGKTRSRSLIDMMMVGKSEKRRPVAPGPPLKSVSPEKSTPPAASKKQQPPGVCPGVWITSSDVPPADTVIPSARNPSGDRSG